MKLKVVTLIISLLLIKSLAAQWQSDVRLTNNPAISSTSGNNAWCIAAKGNSVHVVWSDNRDGNYEIYYKRSTDGGVSWGTDTRLTNAPADSYSPSVSVSDSVVHVVWQDNRDGVPGEIYYKRSIDGGVNWGIDTRLTNETDGSWYPSVTVSGSAVYVVWQNVSFGHWEIYYKHSPNGGISWEADTRLTNNAADSQFPSVSVSGSAVHVVWFDYRDGNYEIYYKNNPTGNVTGIENIGSELPQGYRLEQNYPNPFNPSTVISWRLAVGSFVSLKVYDVIGNEIAVLVNDEKPAGNYEFKFDAASLASGIYFYKLQTGRFIQTKKMILIK